MNQLSIFVFGLLVSLAQFALLSEGGLFDRLKPKTSSDVGPITSSRAMPDVPPDLQYLSRLATHLVAIEPGLDGRANFIEPKTLSDCAGRYMKREFAPANSISTMSRDFFAARVRSLIIEPCQRLYTLNEEWYNRLKEQTFTRQPDSWFFTVRICNEIVVQQADEFIDHAYAYFRSDRS